MAAGGFTEDGLGLAGTSGYFQIVIVSKPSFDAQQVDGEWVLVGNAVGSTKPATFHYADVTGDRMPDLVLNYSMRATLDIRSGSSKKEPIGIHYWGADGQGYLVPDIFKLGMPLNAIENDGSGGGPFVEEDSGIDLPGGEDLGDELLLDEYGTVVLPDGGPVTVEVFTVTGRKIRTVVSGELSAGRHELAWDGRNEAGERVSAGMYFYRVKTNAGMVVRKLVLTR